MRRCQVRNTAHGRLPAGNRRDAHRQPVHLFAQLLQDDGRTVVLPLAADQVVLLRSGDALLDVVADQAVLFLVDEAVLRESDVMHHRGAKPRAVVAPAEHVLSPVDAPVGAMTSPRRCLQQPWLTSHENQFAEEQDVRIPQCRCP